MNLQKIKLQIKSPFKNPTFYIFILFLSAHVALFNINAAEWGDSYRILRGSEYIRNISYPADEKRPPLFSFVLAIRPSFVDQIFWGRLEMLAISILAFFIFSRLCDVLLQNPKAKILALLLLSFNPDFLYWSIRIMSDVPFAVVCMLALYFCFKWRGNLTVKKASVLGILCGVAVLTRFEGYILFMSVFLGLVFTEGFLSKQNCDMTKLFQEFKKKSRLFISFVSTFIILTLPYLIFRNPLNSKYLDEPAGRIYDVKMVIVFFVSLIFLFGFTAALFFLLKSRKVLFNYFKKSSPILFFTLFELILILLWPAAVPRLFVATLPFLVIPLADAVYDFFEKQKELPSSDSTLLMTGILSVFLFIYVGIQYYFKLQFLVSIKNFFFVVIVLQIAVMFGILLKNYRFFLTAVFLSLIIWSLSAIWVHKDIFKAVKEANVYAAGNLQGVIGYNDLSSVSDWYLNQRGKSNKVIGVFYKYSKREDLDLSKLLEKHLDYLMLTNEHNTDMTIDISNRPYLRLIKEVDYEINGKLFFTKIIKILYLSPV